MGRQQPSRIEMYGDSDCYAGIDVVGGESQGIKLLDNVISGCGWGIFVNDEGPVTDIQIRNNDVFKNSDGIFVLGLKNSQLIRNRVHFNEFSGIGINGSSTGNMILHNVVTGNGFTDMSHDATSTPNNWAGNTCETSDEGDDVDCP